MPTGESLTTFECEEASVADLDRAVEAAEHAFHSYRRVSADARAEFLDRIAEAIDTSSHLLETANAETALPPERLAAERGRTVGQLRMFANQVREGSWVNARIDPARPDRKPLPKPDIRRMLIPIGPVAVFAASNGTPSDLAEYASLISILEDKAGRLIVNGYPTGVEVCGSMQHGGPYPATTDSRTTSVGTAATHRFVRPVAYPDFPPSLLPVELQDANPRKIWRMVDAR
jgi:acyl-CoA reductase-like NAD-dependent aldehyde dehydrogenase